jgi:hypothetical protein
VERIALDGDPGHDHVQSAFGSGSHVYGTGMRVSALDNCDRQRRGVSCVSVVFVLVYAKKKVGMDDGSLTSLEGTDRPGFPYGRGTGSGLPASMEL